MPIVAKATGNIAKLGDLSTFSVSSAAVPLDAADSSGAVPTLTATFADGTETDYLVGETFTLTAPVVGKFEGKVISRSKPANSNRYNISVDSIMSRLNSDLRVYPLADYLTGPESTYIPMYSLEYWSQQCGLFFTKVPGDVLLYQSGYGHTGLFVKDYSRALRLKRYTAVGGTAGLMYARYSRVWAGFGYDMDARTAFPQGQTLATPVPSSAQGDRLVFGVDVDLTGTGRTADVTWQFNGPSGTKPALRIAVDSETGFQLQTASGGSYTTRITSSIPKGDLYSVYASISQANATQTRFTLTVYNSAGLLMDDQTFSISSAIAGSLALTGMAYHGYPGGSGNDLAYGNMFISRMPSVPTKRIEDSKTMIPGLKGANFMVGFSGNVWEHIKQYCAIFHLDVELINGKVTFGPRQRDITVGASLSELNTTIQNREQARNVEVVNQNFTGTGNTPTVLWKADSVYQVAVGEVQTFTVQTPHSILETSQPVCVSGISPFPYKTGAGQYVVTGSDGYIVSPTFWRDQGGSITTETTDVEGEIKVTIKGPDYDSPRAPYRISEGDAGRPALYVTGLGLLASPKTLKVGTGKSRAAKDVGVTLDSPFIGNVKQAYDAAVRAAKTFATPETTAIITEPLSYDEASKLGASPTGALVKSNGNILRLEDASQGVSGISGTVSQHNTIYQLKRSFAGLTIKQQKDYYAGKTIGQVNIKPMKKVN